jgi:ankyrin repeat protein
MGGAVGRIKKSIKDGKLITNDQLLKGACRLGDVHAVRELYDLGLDLGIPFEGEGYTPAWYASYYGHAEVLTLLDELGIDLAAPCDRAVSRVASFSFALS